MSILEELYNGNIRPYEKFIKKNSEYYKLSNLLNEDINKLILTLNEEEKKLFDAIEKSMITLGTISEQERYIDGFCTGAKIMLEIINHKSENFI